MTATQVDVDQVPSREVLRVVELAGGLLQLLDAHGLTGRLPLPARAQAARLRHAVKLAVLEVSGRSPAAPAPAAESGAQLQSWIAAQPWALDRGPAGWVYLLHFCDPATGEPRALRGNGIRGQAASHYWGWTTDLVRRIEREHRNPKWHGPGRLVQVALEAGLSFQVARLEYPATRGRERRLKDQGGAARRCPICRGTGGPLDPAGAVAAIGGAS